MAEAKPYAISKQVVWEAYQKVKANQALPGWTVSPSRRSSPT